MIRQKYMPMTQHTFFMKILTHLFFFFLFPVILFAQNDSSKIIERHQISLQRDSLFAISGQHKELPDSLELSILAALQHYPELNETNIRFITSRIKTTLNVRPTFWSMIFKSKAKRHYVIRINSNRKKAAIALNKVPFNARVGLFGHELAHIVDYNSLNVWGMLGRAIGYLHPRYRMHYEHKIDEMTVDAGLGWQLYDWSKYIQENPNVTENYKLYKKKNYLGAVAIFQKIRMLKMQATVAGM